MFKMSLFKTIPFCNQTKLLFRTQNGNPLYKHFVIRTLNSSPQELPKKPLSLLFEEAVGLTEKVVENNGQSQEEEENGLMSELRKLERDISTFKENPNPKVEKERKEREISEKFNSLIELFGGKKKERKLLENVKQMRETGEEQKLVKKVKQRRETGEVAALKELSVFVNIFVKHLYSKGYFDKANFLVDNKLDFGYFDNKYGRDFIKSAAYKFGKDHQEIAKWLSGDHLKTVARFGCPSLDKISVFAAKRLRKMLSIKEDTVCSQCMLKDSCKYANQGVWGIATKNLLIVDVMKVIILYNLEQVPPELTVPGEVRDSANKLLEKIIKLSQTQTT